MCLLQPGIDSPRPFLALILSTSSPPVGERNAALDGMEYNCDVDLGLGYRYSRTTTVIVAWKQAGAAMEAKARVGPKRCRPAINAALIVLNKAWALVLFSLALVLHNARVAPGENSIVLAG